MNAYWQYNKFIEINREHLIKSTKSFKRNKQRSIRGATISVILISTALIIPAILHIFNLILLLNFISIYFFISNIRRIKTFSGRQTEFLFSYEEAIDRWDKMPQTHSELSYEKILEICKKELYQLIDVKPELKEKEK